MARVRLASDPGSFLRKKAVKNAPIFGIRDFFQEPSPFQRPDRLTDSPFGHAEVVHNGPSRVAVSIGDGEVDQNLQLHELESVLICSVTHL